MFKVCSTILKLLRNTRNTRNHISRFHTEMEEKLLVVVVATTKRTMKDALSNFPPNTEKMKLITTRFASFIAKALCLYSFIENHDVHVIINRGAEL